MFYQTKIKIKSFEVTSQGKKKERVYYRRVTRISQSEIECALFLFKLIPEMIIWKKRKKKKENMAKRK